MKVHISLMLGYYLQKNLQDFVKSLFVICYFIMMHHTICPPTIHALCPIFFTKHLNTVIWVHPLQNLQSFNNACTRTKIRVHIPIQYTFHIGDYKWCMPKKDENFFRGRFSTPHDDEPCTSSSWCLPNKLFISNEFSLQQNEGNLNDLNPL